MIKQHFCVGNRMQFIKYHACAFVLLFAGAAQMRGISSVLLVLSSVFALVTSHECPDDPAVSLHVNVFLRKLHDRVRAYRVSVCACVCMCVRTLNVQRACHFHIKYSKSRLIQCSHPTLTIRVCSRYQLDVRGASVISTSPCGSAMMRNS